MRGVWGLFTAFASLDHFHTATGACVFSPEPDSDTLTVVDVTAGEGADSGADVDVVETDDAGFHGLRDGDELEGGVIGGVTGDVTADLWGYGVIG